MSTENNDRTGQAPGDSSGEVDDAVRVRRVADRASYDRQTINAILDEGWIAHVGTVRDGSAVVIPMYYIRDGDSVLLHGSPAAGSKRRGANQQVCVTVSILDGLVFARSAFHHSMNYRSVVIIGEAVPVDDPDEKAAALAALVERMAPGRHALVRPTTPKERRGAAVLRVSLAKASAKIRHGPGTDAEPDYELGIWAGVVPVKLSYGEPVSDGRLPEGVAAPDNLPGHDAAGGF